jgi:alkylhydroperoxidase/carboxymuconolactone decarboxylase family protein YurZ
LLHDRHAGQKTGTLDDKTRELIALAAAGGRAIRQMHHLHTDAAIKAGASKEELIEALGVAVAIMPAQRSSM